MMRTVCKQDLCTGCMACVGKCKKEAISIQDNVSAYNAVIDESKCVSCGACERVCPNNHKVNLFIGKKVGRQIILEAKHHREVQLLL